MKTHRRRIPMTQTDMLDRLSRGLRPKLRPTQLLELGLCHTNNLDIIARGQADYELMKHFVGSIMTWSRVAELLQIGAVEMSQQLELAHTVLERYRRTGRVGFSGTDYQLAKTGVLVMDSLAEIVDRPTALAAADWSEAYLAALDVCTTSTTSPAINQITQERPAA